MTSEKSAFGSGKSGQGKDMLGPNTEIGRKLKQLYDGVASETVPDRFADLLAELERREKAKPAEGQE